jgi:hypothetical protein
MSLSDEQSSTVPYHFRQVWTRQVTNRRVTRGKPRADVARGLRILIKKLQNLSVNRKINLLSLINSSLAHVLLYHFIVKSWAD